MLYQGDVGAQLIVRTGINYTQLYEPEVVLEVIKPNGQELTKNSGAWEVEDVTEVEDGIVRYYTQAGDLDLVGEYRVQARISGADYDFRGRTDTFKVLRPWEA